MENYIVNLNVLILISKNRHVLIKVIDNCVVAVGLYCFFKQINYIPTLILCHMIIDELHGLYSSIDICPFRDERNIQESHSLKNIDPK